MGIKERVELYNKIEGHRKRPLISYVTSKRDGIQADMASDVLPYLIEQLDSLPKNTTELDFLIVSYGGDPMVAWRIMSLIRERVDRVSVLIPQSAYSAATLVALGGDDIVMHPNGHLGPVDMQIRTAGSHILFSTEDITAFVNFVREDLSITDQEHLRTLFEATCREVGTLGVGFTARSQKLALDLARRLLSLPGEDDDNPASKTIVENLSRQFHSHSYPVSRKEAISMGLPVVKDRDGILEGLMWDLWLDIEADLDERNPFNPIAILLNSSEADKLLAPVPQLDLPSNAPGPSYFQANMSEIVKAIKDAKSMIEPVDFEIRDAIIESARLSFHGLRRGKILASREPNLNLQYNVLVTYRGWEKIHQ